MKNLKKLLTDISNFWAKIVLVVELTIWLVRFFWKYALYCLDGDTDKEI